MDKEETSSERATTKESENVTVKSIRPQVMIQTLTSDLLVQEGEGWWGEKRSKGKEKRKRKAGRREGGKG